MQTRGMVLFFIGVSFIIQGCNILGPNPPAKAKQSQERPADPADPAEVAIGERLFKETRFAELFRATSHGNVNARVEGDPVLNQIGDGKTTLTSPFAGQTMSCVACHFVDQGNSQGLGMRSYAEFTEKSVIPARADGKTHTPRNSPSLLHAAAPRNVPSVFHYDGEFVTLDELVIGGFTGRNFGWMPDQKQEALDQIVQVIREDDGSDAVAAEFGALPYRELLAGKSPRIPKELRLPAEYRIDVLQASDQAVLNVVARLVSVYLEDLDFSRDEEGHFNGSPYDAFLKKNGIPRGPKSWQSDDEYTSDLTERVLALKNPKWVSASEGSFSFHQQAFEFGEEEFEGLKLFLRRKQDPGQSSQFVGNCVACHAAPAFTDYRLHNVGETELQYDTLNGFESFKKLSIPSLEDRQKGALVPASLDLGAWAVLGNPAMPRSQTAIMELLCPSNSCDPKANSELAVATFKTPPLRDLGHSQPYMHTGRHPSLESALLVYVQASNRGKSGYMRVVDPEVLKMQLNPNAIPPLVKFLKSLNEDYN
ncbi:MAG: hypothetical protein JNL01_01650 [Bdellovibrionales bacterium]|nr:hypothetical protein [Bdellovibrionales bacterium]